MKYIRKVALFVGVTVWELATLLAVSFVWAEETINVGYSNEYGLVSASETGQLSGYGYAYLQRIAEETGWNYQFEQCAWSTCLEKLEKGELDILGPLQYSEKRAAIFDFLDVPSGYEYGALYADSENNNIFYEDFESFAGMRVALIRDNFHNKALAEYCIQHHFSIHPIYVDDIADLEKAVHNGEADAFACGSLLTTRSSKVVAKFSVEPFYFGVTKGNQTVRESMNRAMKAIKIENNHYDADLYQKYFKNAAISQPAFTKKEYEYIQQQPPLRIAFSPDRVPVEYYDEASGEFKGININLLTLVAQKSGLSFTPVHTASYTQTLNAFENGQVDVITVHPGIENLNIRGMQLTQPLFEIPMLMVTRQQMPQIPFSIAVPSISPSIDYLRNQHGEEALRYYKTLTECFEALNKENVSAVVISSYAYDEMMRDSRYQDLRIMSVLEQSFPVRLAVSGKANNLLAGILDKTLARISDEELSTQLVAGSVGRSTPITFGKVIKRYSYLFVCAGVSLVLLFAGLSLYHNRKQQKMLRHLAYEDELTGLGNWEKLRLAQNPSEHLEPLAIGLPFQDAGAHVLTRLTRQAMVIVDINNFKLINEYFGYKTGNEALKHFAGLLMKRLKPGEHAARIAADHFGLLLYCADKAELLERLKKLAIAAGVEKTLQFSGIKLTFAFGAAFLDSDDIDISVIRDRADIVRKKCKTADHDSYGLYDEDTHKFLTEERELGEEVRAAFVNRSFTVYLQPKYGIKENKFISAEALVRWEHPQRGLISPDIFIRILEKNGFIKQLDMYVLDEVCKTLRLWEDNGLCLLPIAVNMSKLHVLYESFVPDVCAVVRKYGIAPKYVEIELTETAFLNNTPQLLKAMRELSEAGFTLTMDDFGTGFSSLNMLREIPVNVLKLDRAFFNFADSGERGKMIISHVIRMAKALNMHVVSEGIETAEQVDFLRQTECDMIQGYFFARPMTIQEFTDLMFGKMAALTFTP